MTTLVVTTLAMCLSVIAFCVMPISDTSDHCISDGCIGVDHVSGDNIVMDISVIAICVISISDTSDNCLSDDHVSGDNISDVYFSDRFLCDSYQ